MKRSPDELSFFEHLDELRSRLIKSLIAVLAAACVFYAYTDRVLAQLIRPVGKVIFTSPADALLARITLTFWGGMFFALPVVLYQIWRFIASGLREKERRMVYFFAPFSFLLFLAGGAFAYFVMIPMTLNFLLGFGSEAIVPMIAIKSYISFVGLLILGSGVTFELPLVLMFLTKIGVATPDFFARKRRHAVVIILIVSAVVTPPDVVSQIVMAVPLVVLYEIGIVVSRWTYRKTS